MELTCQQEVAAALPCQLEGASYLVVVASSEACTGVAVAWGVVQFVEEQANRAAHASALEGGIVQQELVVVVVERVESDPGLNHCQKAVA